MLQRVPHGCVDEYLVWWPWEILQRALTVRELILRVVPDAQESISYGMPAYVIRGKPLVYFGVYKKHLGFYATPEVHDHFASALCGYKQGKWSVQFPHSQPLPLALIEQMINYKKSILEQR